MQVKGGKSVTGVWIFPFPMVLFMCFFIGISYSATQAEIEQAIDSGISWLVAQQQGDGSWDPSGEPVACTGLAVIKLADRAFELGYTPFDPDYPYKNAIESGLNFIFQNGFVVDIYDQPAGNPDTDNDGKGVHFGGEYRTIYSTGICMMAIAATRAPDRVVGSIGSEVDGWTYKQVLDDVVDFMAFAQTDTPNPGRGGWRYREQVIDADNSNTGYAVSGLGYAESSIYGFGCAVPQFVKDELNIYIDYIQCDPGDSGHNGGIDGSSGYYSPCDSYSNVLKTGNLIGEMTLAGRPYNDSDLQRALAYIGRTWNDTSRDPGWGNGGTPHYQAMLCVTRGLVYAGIDTIVVDGSPRDWYADFADAIVSSQQPDGSWPVDFWAGQMFATEWALLILEKSAPTPCRLELKKDDHVDEGDCRGPSDTITYTISWENTGDETVEDVVLTDFLPKGVNFDDFVEGVVYQPITPPPADPNVIYGITDADNLTDVTLPVGQSVQLYVNKQTIEEDVFSFYLEATISDPNLGWIDNMEYDPNSPGTAEILAQPRASFFDYYGPGYTQPEGIQFFAANFGNAIQDGNLASFVYTATQPGYVVLTLVDYNAVPATLEEIIIRQTDPNDPNNVPEEPEESEEPPAYSASSIEGVYNEPNHTVTWELGDITPGGYGSVSFSVTVNYKAEPGMTLHNVAEAYTGQTLIARRSVDTPVCCWGGNVIYVNKRATGNNNGTNWMDAYTDLQDALYRAGNSTCEDVNTIYVAQGEYSPGTRVIDSFVLPDGVSVYGGFKSGGCDFEYRNPKIYVTTLTGYIDPNNSNETVAVMGDETLLDGVVVCNGDYYGILGSGVDFNVSNCTVRGDERYGIWAENGNVSINWSSIENNGWDGVHHLNSGTSLTVENSQINRNGRNGISDANSIPMIRNNVICGNGIKDSGYWGVFISDPKGTPLLHNNTIAYNYNEAVAYTDSDPNHDNLPDIQNCIIWYNNDNGEQFAGHKPPRHYSCIYDPNYPGGTNETIDNNGNFSHKPEFAYPYSTDPNVFINVHLATNPYSFCKDKGNLNLSYAGQKDMDNEDRAADGQVDVGADEITCDNVYNAYDWNADGIVNLNEFRKFSDVWLAHDPNDPAVLDPNSPENDPNSPYYISQERQEQWHSEGYKYNLSIEGESLYSIDVADLLVFIGQYPDTDHWLWAACWRHDIQEMQQMNMMMGGAEGMMASLLPETSQSVEAVSVSSPAEMIPAASIVQPVETVVTESVEPEKPIKEQIADLQEAIQLLESIGNDPNTQLETQPLDWQRFMDDVYNSLTELQEKDIITQDKVED
jgi:hypothetical protein